MARSLRVEYAGAYFHVMARGNRRGWAENAERRERESDIQKNRMEESPEEAARTFAEYIAEERS